MSDHYNTFVDNIHPREEGEEEPSRFKGICFEYQCSEVICQTMFLTLTGLKLKGHRRTKRIKQLETTVNQMRQYQAWLRKEAIKAGGKPADFPEEFLDLEFEEDE